MFVSWQNYHDPVLKNCGPLVFSLNDKKLNGKCLKRLLSGCFFAVYRFGDFVRAIFFDKVFDLEYLVSYNGKRRKS